MSHNYYSEINLHIVWHTKKSLPLLSETIEPMAHRYLRERVVDTAGAYVHAIGGIATHVHLAVTIPPNLTVNKWIGQLKGGVSHEVNHRLGRHESTLEWQAGYGVVSFGTNDLDWVIRYIRNQHQHHARHTTHQRLEQITTVHQPR